MTVAGRAHPPALPTAMTTGLDRTDCASLLTAAGLTATATGSLPVSMVVKDVMSNGMYHDSCHPVAVTSIPPAMTIPNTPRKGPPGPTLTSSGTARGHATVRSPGTADSVLAVVVYRPSSFDP